MFGSKCRCCRTSSRRRGRTIGRREIRCEVWPIRFRTKIRLSINSARKWRSETASCLRESSRSTNCLRLLQIGAINSSCNEWYRFVVFVTRNSDSVGTNWGSKTGRLYLDFSAWNDMESSRDMCFLFGRDLSPVNPNRIRFHERQPARDQEIHNSKTTRSNHTSISV